MKGKAANEIELWKRPKGYSAAARLVDAFDSDMPLPAKDLKLFIDALRVFTAVGETDKHLQEFGRLALLRGKQGRHEPTWGESQPRIELAYDVIIRERQLAREGHKSPHSQAVIDVSLARHRHKRTVQRAFSEFGEFASTSLDFAKKMAEPAIAMHNMIVGWMGGEDAIAKGMAKAIKAKTRDTKS